MSLTEHYSQSWSASIQLCEKDLLALDGFDFQQWNTCYAQQVSLVISLIWFSRNVALLLIFSDLLCIDLLSYFCLLVFFSLFIRACKLVCSLFFPVSSQLLPVYFVIRCLLKRDWWEMTLVPLTVSMEQVTVCTVPFWGAGSLPGAERFSSSGWVAAALSVTHPILQGPPSTSSAALAVPNCCWVVAVLASCPCVSQCRLHFAVPGECACGCQGADKQHSLPPCARVMWLWQGRSLLVAGFGYCSSAIIVVTRLYVHRWTGIQRCHLTLRSYSPEESYQSDRNIPFCNQIWERRKNRT